MAKKASLKRRVLFICLGGAFGALLGRMTPVHADEVDAIVMGHSWHFGHQHRQYYNDYSPNDWNWGGGLEYRHDGWLIGGLQYRDSFRKHAYTFYGGYQYTVPITTNLAFTATARAGYLNGSGWHGPAIIPSIGFQYKRVGIEATYLPKTGNGWNAVGVFLRFSFPLK